MNTQLTLGLVLAGLGATTHAPAPAPEALPTTPAVAPASTAPQLESWLNMTGTCKACFRTPTKTAQREVLSDAVLAAHQSLGV